MVALVVAALEGAVVLTVLTTLLEAVAALAEVGRGVVIGVFALALGGVVRCSVFHFAVSV